MTYQIKTNMKLTKEDANAIKDKILNIIPEKSQYAGSYVREVIRTANISDVELFKDLQSQQMRPPSVLKKGDVIITQVGSKMRPVVIVKVLEEEVIYIPLTSTENVHNLIKGNCRFFGESWFSKGFSVATIEYAMEHFVGIYTDRITLNKAIKLNKEYFK